MNHEDVARAAQLGQKTGMNRSLGMLASSDEYESQMRAAQRQQARAAALEAALRLDRHGDGDVPALLAAAKQIEAYLIGSDA